MNKILYQIDPDSTMILNVALSGGETKTFKNLHEIIVFENGDLMFKDPMDLFYVKSGIWDSLRIEEYDSRDDGM